MDNLSDIKHYMREFADARDWQQFHTPKNLSMALSAEVGELIELFQWLSDEQIRRLKLEQRKQVAFELADILMYLVRLSDELNIDLIDAVREKAKMNEHRFPVEASKAMAKHLSNDAD